MCLNDVIRISEYILCHGGKLAGKSCVFSVRIICFNQQIIVAQTVHVASDKSVIRPIIKLRFRSLSVKYISVGLNKLQPTYKVWV